MASIADCNCCNLLLRVTSEYQSVTLHDTPRLHTLMRVIRIFFIPRTYNESCKLTLFFRVYLDGRKVGHFLITIQKSFKLIIN